jgi:flagellar basal-body rod modification protein FlgD
MTVISPYQAQAKVIQTQSQQDFSKASLNYDSFLKLLLQQLKSQDPTSPVDQKETLAQLASFSNVEQTIKLNQKLDTVLDQQRTVEASTLIGKHIKSLITNEEGYVQSAEVSQGRMLVTLDSGTQIEISRDFRISQ